MQKKTNRDPAIDLIRVISMTLVIFVHTPGRPFGDSPLAAAVLTSLLLVCNGNFFMLSGMLNLRRTCESPRAYWEYYLRRFIAVGVPFIALIAVITLRNAVDAGTLSPYRIAANFVANVLGGCGNMRPHLWFMGPMIGLLASAPFLARMLNNMKRWELTLLLGIALAWRLISTNLTADMGFPFGYSAWMLSGWLTVFVAGFWCAGLTEARQIRRLYIAGAVCFVLNIAAALRLPGYSGAYDLAPLYVVFEMALFTFLLRAVRIPEGPAASVIRFLGQRSFSVYLLHWFVIFEITNRLIPEVSGGMFVVHGLLSLVITAALASAVDLLVLCPIQRLLTRLALKTKKQPA